MSTSTHHLQTHDSDAMTRKTARIAEHTAAAPVMAPLHHTDEDFDNLRAAVDRASQRGRDANKRLKLHMAFVSCGIVLNVAITFVNLGLVLHFGAVLVGSPSILYEFTDWLRGW